MTVDEPKPISPRRVRELQELCATALEMTRRGELVWTKHPSVVHAFETSLAGRRVAVRRTTPSHYYFRDEHMSACTTNAPILWGAVDERLNAGVDDAVLVAIDGASSAQRETGSAPDPLAGVRMDESESREKLRAAELVHELTRATRERRLAWTRGGPRNWVTIISRTRFIIIEAGSGSASFELTAHGVAGDRADLLADIDFEFDGLYSLWTAIESAMKPDVLGELIELVSNAGPESEPEKGETDSPIGPLQSALFDDRDYLLTFHATIAGTAMDAIDTELPGTELQQRWRIGQETARRFVGLLFTDCDFRPAPVGNDEIRGHLQDQNE